MADELVDIESPASPPQTRKVPVPILQERFRHRLAFILLIILGFEILFALTVTWLPGEMKLQNVPLDMMKAVMELVFGPTIALVGSATGFYFGTKATHSD